MQEDGKEETLITKEIKHTDRNSTAERVLLDHMTQGYPRILRIPSCQHQHKRKGEGTGGETQTTEGRMLLSRGCRRSPTSLDLEPPRRHLQA